MKTVMIDGREVAVDDTLSSKQITELTRPDGNQFSVIARDGANGEPPKWIPVQKDSRKHYPVQDGDSLRNLYRVENGEQ